MYNVYFQLSSCLHQNKPFIIIITIHLCATWQLTCQIEQGAPGHLIQVGMVPANIADHHQSLINVDLIILSHEQRLCKCQQLK